MASTCNRLVVCLLLTSHVASHVIWLSPPARQNIGQQRPECRLPVNYDESGTYCGGFGIQHNAVNKGRCSICGDEYSAPVKPHQAGGEFATGTLAASYRPGQEVAVTVNLAANHQGFFTFAVCPHNNPATAPGPDCFRQYPLQVNGGKYFPASPGSGVKTMKIRLPEGLTCSQCILQMTYTTGNNWGAGGQSAEVQTESCLKDLTGRLGCGPQETFRGCADICIGAGDFCPRGPCAKAGSRGTSALGTTRASFTTAWPTTAISTTTAPVSTTIITTPDLTTMATRPVTLRTIATTPVRRTIATTPVTRTISTTSIRRTIATSPVTRTKLPSTINSFTPFSTTTTPAPKPKSPKTVSICRSAGIKFQFYSVAGEAYCKYYCLNRTRVACWAGANTAYLCYCNMDATEPAYQALILSDLATEDQ
jgi:hypothetical protein